MPTCKGCQKPIEWGTTEAGKKIPLDPRPPVYLLEDGVAKRLHNAYVTHFATCPDANKFSASKKKQGDLNL